MIKSILNLMSLSYYFVQLPSVTHFENEPEEKSELFHFLKAVATEELDKLDSWDSDDGSDDYSDIDETMIELPTDMFTPTLPKSKRAISKRNTSPRQNSKKTSLCKGITRR